MMDELIRRFPAQLKEAISIGEKAAIRPHTQPLQHVYVAGLGGSGIGANFVSEFVRNECPIPYLVGKGYDIPNYIDAHSLCIVSSYSGNTEETLSAFDALSKTGAKLVCIASGGRLIELAKSMSLDHIRLPDDWPSPRACLGYSLVQQLFVLRKLNLIGQTTIDQVDAASDFLLAEQTDISDRAARIAQLIFDKIPIIYVEDRMESVAVRLRQQLNENAKMLCWHHVIPEMNHNELVGWRTADSQWAVVYLRNADDYARNQMRMEINKEIIRQYASTLIEIFSKGKNAVERALYLVHMGDWISWHVSQLRGVDAIEVDVIDYLKGELRKV